MKARSFGLSEVYAGQIRRANLIHPVIAVEKSNNSDLHLRSRHLHLIQILLELNKQFPDLADPAQFLGSISRSFHRHSLALPKSPTGIPDSGWQCMTCLRVLRKSVYPLPDHPDTSGRVPTRFVRKRLRDTIFPDS